MRKTTGGMEGDGTSAFNWPVHLGVFTAAMLLVILIRGYAFAEWDVLQLLPSYFRVFDPGYHPTDWVFSISSRIDHRFFFALLLGAPAQLIGWPASAFLVFLLSWYLTYDGIVRITRAATGRLILGYAAALIAIVVLDEATLGKNFYAGEAVTRQLARGLAFVGFGLWLSRRWISGGVFLGMATNAHVVTGVEFSGFIMAAFAVHALATRRYPWAMWKGLLAWAVVAGPMLAYLLWAFHFSPDANLNAYEWSRVLAYIRLPHHYLPHTWEPSRWGMLVLEVAVAVVAWIHWRPEEPKQREAWHTVGIVAPLILASMVVYVIGTEVFWSTSIMKLEFFLNSAFLRVICVVGFVGLLGSRSKGTVRNAGTVTAVVFAGGVLFSGVVSAFFGLIVADRLSWPMLIALAAIIAGRDVSLPWIERRRDLFGYLLIAIIGSLVLVSLFNAAAFTHLQALLRPVTSAPLMEMAHGLLRQALLSVLILLVLDERWEVWFLSAGRGVMLVPTGLLLVMMVLSASPSLRRALGNQFPVRRVSFGLRELGPADNELFEWAARETEPDAVFLTPPDGRRWARFRLERPVVFSYLVFRLEPRGTMEWFNRFQDICRDSTDVSHWKREGAIANLFWVTHRYRRQDTGTLLHIARKYGASYIVRERDWAPLDLPVAFENRAWVVYRVPDAEVEMAPSVRGASTGT